MAVETQSMVQRPKRTRSSYLVFGLFISRNVRPTSSICSVCCCHEKRTVIQKYSLIGFGRMSQSRPLAFAGDSHGNSLRVDETRFYRDLQAVVADEPDRARCWTSTTSCKCFLIQ
jgi:hypothetical protein